MKATEAPASEQAPETAEQSLHVELPDSLLHHQHLLFNRELSWLEFNRRVLEEAFDRSHPLLERLKFLSIFSTNLDEFFMVRVSGLKEEMDEDVVEASPDGLTPSEQLKQISTHLRPLLEEQMRYLRDEIIPQLHEEGIEIVAYQDLNESERQQLKEYFLENVFPVLTPQAVDRSHPFPYVSSMSVNLALMVEPLEKGDKQKPRFARIKFPPTVPRLIPVGTSGAKFTFLGQMIAANTECLFQGMHVGQGYLFRVTRDADFELREDEAADLLQSIKQQILRRRRFGMAVRLEVGADMPNEMVKYLTESLELTPDDIYAIDGPLNVPDLMLLYQLDRPELKDKPLQATLPARLKESRSIFNVIRQQDVLLHHPYTSYTAVTDFINAAAKDADVVAIKMCLYRTGQNSPIVQALMEASERGKQVAVLIELKARFDEENNIEWARQLERAGVHVVYGLSGLKTHCKVALVVRREKNKLKRYVHIATGNYNPTTSRIYTDLGLMTADEAIGADATDLFNYLTGYSKQSEYRRLLVAPVSLRQRMISLIEREASHCREGKQGRIVAKVNSLTDLPIIRALYEASQAGVEIDMIVRGICMLRPGVAGLSEKIRVRSIVGRYLEHSRLFYFENNGEEEFYIGSADWMNRNLDRRIEVVVPIDDQQWKRYLKEEIIASYLRDNVKARLLQPDGTYTRPERLADEDAFSCQDEFAADAARFAMY